MDNQTIKNDFNFFLKLTYGGYLTTEQLDKCLNTTDKSIIKNENKYRRSMNFSKILIPCLANLYYRKKIRGIGEKISLYSQERESLKLAKLICEMKGLNDTSSFNNQMLNEKFIKDIQDYRIDKLMKTSIEDMFEVNL